MPNGEAMGYVRKHKKADRVLLVSSLSVNVDTREVDFNTLSQRS